MQRHEIVMLHYALLKYDLMAVFEVLVQVAVIFCGVYLLDALAAHAVDRLRHEHGVLFHKPVKLLPRGGGHIQPVPVHEFGKVLCELELVLNFRHVLRVVETLYKAVVYAPRDYRPALSTVQIIHLKQGIIHVACLIHKAAPDHVEEDKQLALAAFFVHLVDLLEELLIVHLGDAANKIFQFAHSEPRFQISKYHSTTRP